MKKFVALLLAGAMVLSLTACGGGKKEETKAPETKEAAGENAEVAEPSGDVEKIKIGLCQPFTGPAAVAGENVPEAANNPVEIAQTYASVKNHTLTEEANKQIQRRG